MNKRYLPAIASLLLIAITLTSFVPVFAALPTRLVSQPTLRVTTIAEDDEVRQTGVMWMGTGFTAATLGTGVSDLMAQFKILVSYNGVPVTPTSIFCQFVEKDKAEPLKTQLNAESLVSVPRENTNFLCKPRWGKPGVGVLDVYYIGEAAGQFIADYIMVVGVDLAVGRTTVFGTEIQDICLLGWPISVGVDLLATPLVAAQPFATITKGNGDEHLIYQDPLGVFTSCEDLALIQKLQVGVLIPWV